MTDEKKVTLTVTPIDRSAPGSWRDIRTLTSFAASAQRGRVDIVKLDEFMSVLEAHVAPPDGMTLDDALASVTFDDMIELAKSIAGGDDDSGEDGSAS